MGAPVELRAATAADLPWLRELATSDAVAPFLATDAAAGLADAVASAEVLIAHAPRGPRVGAVRAAVVNRRSRIAAVRTLMADPGARGRRLGVEVLGALVRRLVDDEGIHRVEAEVYGFNDAALRTFDRAGFRREGVRRRAYDRHGAWQDGVAFGLLAEDLH